MTIRLDVISLDYLDGNIIMVINLWGDRVTLSVPLPEAVIRKIRNSERGKK